MPFSENITTWINVFILASSMILVLIYGESRRLKLTYTLFTVGLLLWLISLVIYYSPDYEQYLLTTGRFNFVTLSIATSAYYFFIKVFTQEDLRFGLKEFLYIFFALTVTLLTMFSPMIILNEVALPDGQRATDFGSLYVVYLIKILLDLSFGCYVAIRNYRKATEEKKIQIRIFLAATIVAILIGGTTNLLLPQLGIFTFQEYGPLALIILNFSIVYLILKYQFLNIKILIGRLFYYGILMFLSLGTFLFLEYLLVNKLTDADLLIKIIAFVLIALCFVIAFNTLNEYLRRQVRVRFVNPGYDPYEVIETFNKKVSGLLTLQDISKEYINVIQNTIRPSTIRIETVNGKATVYRMLLENSENRIFEIHDLQNLEKKNNLPEEYKRNLQNTIEYMQKEDLRIIAPLKDQNNLVAVALIGKRESDYNYSGYDKEFILSLNQIVNISITRTLLYQQIEEFNKSLQNKINEQTAELQEKVKLLEEARKKEADMIDIMGHELRTPATVVKLNADLLKQFSEKVTQDRESFNKYVGRIKDAVETEIKLINTLLSSAKLEGDKVEINKERVDISREIEMAIHGEEIHAAEKGIEMINKVPMETTPVYTDHARTVEILNNLISNAVKYTDSGSITVDAYEDDNYVYISVEDTGRGIAPEDLKKLGTKFFRTKTYIQSEEKDDFDIVRPGGTGLGLYVTFGLVKKMGGKIDIQSELGKGSKFTVSFEKYTDQQEYKVEKDSTDMFARMGLKKESGDSQQSQ